LVAYDILEDRIAFGDRSVPARLAMVTDDFWALAGAQPARGRLPQPGEDAVMLSHAFFERWFVHQPDVVGSMVTIDGRTERLAGVLPPGFHVQLPPPPAWAALTPGPIDGYRVFAVDPPVGGRVQLMRVLGLLAPGVSVEAARGELESVRRRVARDHPGIPAEGVLHVTPLAEKLLGDARLSVLVLFTAVVLVLLIACANIALLLARAGARQREIAIRGAIGASRARLIRQFLAESLLLAGAGACVGVGLAHVALQVTLRLIPQAVPRLTETTIDARVLAFAVVLSMVTAVLCGLGPGVAFSRGSTAAALKDGPRSTGAVTIMLPVRTWLVAIEMALTVVLLCSAGLLVKSIWRLHQYPEGFAPDRTLVTAVKFLGQDDDRRRAYLDEGLRRLQALPGIESWDFQYRRRAPDGNPIVVARRRP
jgi:putative ABC transport system permease protein